MNMYYCGKPGCPGHNSFSAVCTRRDYSNYKQPSLQTILRETFEGDADDESGPQGIIPNWLIESEDLPPVNGRSNAHSNGHTNGNVTKPLTHNGNGNGNGHSANGNGAKTDHTNGNGAKAMHTNGNGNSQKSDELRNWAVESTQNTNGNSNGNGHSANKNDFLMKWKRKANLKQDVKNLRNKKKKDE